MKASGVSIYLNCEDVSYSSRDNQATIQKLKEHIVSSADESRYMYSTFLDFVSYWLIGWLSFSCMD